MALQSSPLMPSNLVDLPCNMRWSCWHTREDEAADLEAFQRQYEDDQSWTALQEDEFGRLRPLVKGSSTSTLQTSIVTLPVVAGMLASVSMECQVSSV